MRRMVLTAIAEALKQQIGSPLQLLKTRFDPNDWRNIKKSAEGLCQVPLTTDRGKRVGSREYVQTVAKICPENLTVKLNALVTRVILDDENRAIGPRIYRGQAFVPRRPECGRDCRQGQ